MKKIMLQKTFETNTIEEMDKECNNFKQTHEVRFSTPMVIKDPNNPTKLRYITVLYHEQWTE